jgi:hypothetical protein
VKRLIAGLAVLMLAVLASGCGQSTAVSGPAVEVAWEQGTGFDGVWEATLTPRQAPRGVLALKVVQDGSVRTVAWYRFTALAGRGSVRVTASPHSIVVSSHLPGSGKGQRTMQLVIGPRMKDSGAAWSGSSVGPSDLGEETIWEQERALGHPPTGNSGMTIGSFEALVRDSTQYPKRTAYCLTLEVEPQ